MINKKNKLLAINGGKPVTNEIIPIHKPYLDKDDLNSVIKAFETTFISGDGPDCREFEKEIAKYLDVKHVFFMNSATSALDLAYRVKDFQNGGEVIVPNFTYTSTALGPLYNNLKIKLIDVDPKSGLIDVAKIYSLINKNTVAISPVDYGGCPVDMDSIKKIAEDNNLWIVHDAAQSLGAEYMNRKTGSIADISIFSFHGTKNLVTGEGGALVTNDDAVAERIKVMRDKGTDKYSFLSENKDRGYYEYIDIGNSYVQSNLLGALGVSQLKKIDFMNGRRKQIAEYYISSLENITGLDLPYSPPNVQRNWHLFDLHVEKEEKFWILDALRAEGVHVNVHYTPLHKNRFYQHHGSDSDFPGTMKFYDGLLRLPIYPSLTTDELKVIVNAVKKVLSS